MKTSQFAAIGLCLACVSFPGFVAAQNQSIDSDIQILRANIRADKVQVVSQEMQLSDEEAKAFWPLYNKYEAELTKLNDERVALLKEYADKYDNLTNEQVQSLAHRNFDLQKRRVDLRADYFKKISRAISPKTAARFAQVEDRIDLLLNLQLAASVPMVQK
jgi:Skp family chaperone for outer membrane proteins